MEQKRKEFLVTEIEKNKEELLNNKSSINTSLLFGSFALIMATSGTSYIGFYGWGIAAIIHVTGIALALVRKSGLKKEAEVLQNELNNLQNQNQEEKGMSR